MARPKDNSQPRRQPPAGQTPSFNQFPEQALRELIKDELAANFEKLQALIVKGLERVGKVDVMAPQAEPDSTLCQFRKALCDYLVKHLTNRRAKILWLILLNEYEQYPGGFLLPEKIVRRANRFENDTWTSAIAHRAKHQLELEIKRLRLEAWVAVDAPGHSGYRLLMKDDLPSKKGE